MFAFNPRILCCLTLRDGDDQFVSIRERAGTTKIIEHRGRTFKRTPKRTAGGWRIFREVTA